MNHSTPGLLVHHQLPEFTQTHVHRVGDAIQPSRFCRPLLLPPIHPSIRVFSNELTLHMRWAKYWSFNFSVSPSNEHPGLISFRMTGCIALQSRGLSRVFSDTTAQKHQFFGAQLSPVQISHPYMTTGKIIALSRWTFVGKAMSLLFNMLSKVEKLKVIKLPSTHVYLHLIMFCVFSFHYHSVFDILHILCDIF